MTGNSSEPTRTCQTWWSKGRDPGSTGLPQTPDAAANGHGRPVSDPTGNFVVSGSMDSSIIIWNINKVMKKKQIQLAHKAGVFGVTYVNETTVASVGKCMCSDLSYARRNDCNGTCLPSPQEETGALHFGT